MTPKETLDRFHDLSHDMGLEDLSKIYYDKPFGHLLDCQKGNIESEAHYMRIAPIKWWDTLAGVEQKRVIILMGEG